jgi:hypothetical protein
VPQRLVGRWRGRKEKAVAVIFRSRMMKANCLLLHAEFEFKKEVRNKSSQGNTNVTAAHGQKHTGKRFARTLVG